MQIAESVKQVWEQIEVRFQREIRKLKKHIRDLTNQNDETVEDQARSFRIWMWASALGLTIILILSVFSKADEHPSSSKNTVSEKNWLDQLPDGYLVAPIEPANPESLDSIFDQHGYVDLYRGNSEFDDTTKKRGPRIARGLAMIRAPKDPRRFAVLVRETDSDILEALQLPVVVVLRKSAPSPISEKKSKQQAPTKGRIDLIEEEIPVYVSTDESGAKS